MTTTPKLTTKATRENARRKRQAREALAAYAKVVGQQTEDRETNLLDLLADLMHLMGPETVQDCLRRGTMHYEAEARGED
jgi:hypothetical protein